MQLSAGDVIDHVWQCMRSVRRPAYCGRLFPILQAFLRREAFALPPPKRFTFAMTSMLISPLNHVIECSFAIRIGRLFAPCLLQVSEGSGNL